MSFPIAKAAHDTLEAAVNSASAALNGFTRLPNGLITDDVRVTPEYRSAKQTFDNAFRALRAFNAVYADQYKKEIRAAILAKRQSVMG